MNNLCSYHEDVLRKIGCSSQQQSMGIHWRNTVVGGRYVANVVIGSLFADSPRDIHLLDSEVLDIVNHTIITAIFDTP
jgi:hypothetical protein